MKSLVEDLKKEHEGLKNQVALIKELGIMTPDGFKELLHLKELLADHIKHEDLEMYPLLEQAAKDDASLSMLLTHFREEMNKITAAAEKFYGCYTEPKRSLEYSRDVANTFSQLSNRMITEESILYPRLANLL